MADSVFPVYGDRVRDRADQLALTKSDRRMRGLDVLVLFIALLLAAPPFVAAYHGMKTQPQMVSAPAGSVEFSGELAMMPSANH